MPIPSRSCRRWLRATALAFALGVAAVAAPAAQSTQATGRDLASRAVAAMGGRTALGQLRSFRGIGTVEFLSGFPGRFEVQAVLPDKRHVAIDIGYVQHERGYDGQLAWERNASVRQLAGRELERARAWAWSLPLLRFLDRGLDPIVEPRGAAGPVLRFEPPGERPTRIVLDAETFLPTREVLLLPFEEGVVETPVDYGDWRSVGNVTLPHQIRWGGRDLPYSARIDRYELNAVTSSDRFEYPHTANLNEPYAMTIATIPRTVYREPVVTAWQRQWGIPFPPTERWVLDVVVNETYGRWLEPLSARVEYLAGDEVVKTLGFSAAGLARLIKFPVTRFAPQPQIYNFRMEFYEPTTLAPDRLAISYEAKTVTGARVRAAETIPIRRYERPRPLLFPVKGNFIIQNGHAFQDVSHVYEWSQHFANDIVCLGPNFDLAVNSRAPTRNEDFYAFGRCEIIAPDDGTVVFARNDVPDGRVPAEYLQMNDPIWAIGGNIILLDHGRGEYSLLAHNQLGSVRVKTGDRVVRGQVLALMGASGSPGAPHLHYQLQSSAGLFDGDGLPSLFHNVYRPGGEGSVRVPQPGVFYEAR